MCIEIAELLSGQRENAMFCVSDADVNVICSRERAANWKADPCIGAAPSKHRKIGLPVAPKKYRRSLKQQLVVRRLHNS